jgi:glycogen debranching enzyme
MTTESIRADGLERALAMMRSCIAQEGFLATPEPHDNYRRVWGRDSSIMSLAAAASGDDELVAAAKRTFRTLARYQGPHGEIPSTFDPQTGRVSYGGTAGRVDNDLWFVIGSVELWRRTGDHELLEQLAPSLERVRYLLGAWEFNNRGLIYVPLTGDWADEYLQHGYVLYDNLLNLQAQRSFAALHEHLHGAPDHDLEARINRLQQLLRANYWFDPDRDSVPEYVYHSVLYEKAVHAERRCAGKHWLPFFAPTGYGYRFDGFANVLVSLLGVADDLQRENTDGFIDSIVPENLPLLPAFHPVIRPIDDDWEELQMSFSYSFKNRPYEFHNGGLWPLITGFYAADLAQRGRRKRALRFVEAVHRANSLEMGGDAWSFPEFVHGKDLLALGNPRQGWSAAVAVLAERALAGEPVFSVPNHLY